MSPTGPNTVLPEGPVLVTGAAGFIGSRLVGRLEADGRSARGIDCYTDFYDVGLKRRRAERLRTPIEVVDLRSDDLVLGFGVCRLRRPQHHRNPAPARGLRRRRGAALRRGVQLLDLRRVTQDFDRRDDRS